MREGFHFLKITPCISFLAFDCSLPFFFSFTGCSLLKSVSLPASLLSAHISNRSDPVFSHSVTFLYILQKTEKTGLVAFLYFSFSQRGRSYILKIAVFYYSLPSLTAPIPLLVVLSCLFSKLNGNLKLLLKKGSCKTLNVR